MYKKTMEVGEETANTTKTITAHFTQYFTWYNFCFHIEGANSRALGVPFKNNNFTVLSV